MPTPSHRLPRALLLSVGLHLGLGLWLWTRNDPEPPTPAPLQVPMALQFFEVSPPPQAAPPQPGIAPMTPPRHVLVPRAKHRQSPPVQGDAESPASQVAQGGVHPYFPALGRAILHHWNPEHVLAILGFTDSFSMTLGARHAVGRVMSEHDASSMSLRDRRALRQKTKHEARSTRRATVRVIQDATGKLLNVWVISSSYDRTLDVVIADSVARAVARQPPPSPALQGREIWMSLWQIELTFSEHPPGPGAALTFDGEMKPTEFQLPPGLHLYKRVQMLEVR